MRKVRKGLLVLISGVIIVLLAAGSAWAQSASAKASASASASTGGSGGTFIEGTINNVSTVNPWKAIESPEYEILALNFDLLENFDKSTLQAAPGVATSWTQSPDGLTWTFNIRPGMTWQDGQPFTAKDIAWTYNKTLDCKLGNSLDYLVPEFTNSITAPSDTQLVWSTKKPTSAPIRPPWVYIAPEHIYGNDTCDQISKEPFFTEGHPMVGSGPFQLTDWVKGQSWTMTANPNYWGGAPHISQFKVVLYDNSEAMVNALKAGEIDYTNLGSVDLFNQLQTESQSGSSNITTHVGPAVTFGQMSFNMCDPTSPTAAPYCKNNPGTGNPALRDPAVRTAISWAIDRQTIVDKVLAGYGEPGTTVVPPFASFYHYNPTPDEMIGFDINKAKQILADAGYKDTDGNGILNDPKTGQDLNFRFILRAESDIGARLGQYITGWLKQIGIATTSEVVSDGKLSQAWLADDYDMYIWGWGPDPDPDFILSTYTSSQCGTWSDTCYSNPEYDKLYKEQQTAPTPQDRQAIVFKMQDIIYKDIPEIVLYYDKSLEAYNSAKWTGLEDNVSPQPDGFLWNQYTPYSALTVQLRSGASASSGGTSSGLLIIVGILGAIVVIVGIVMVVRRGKSEEDLA
ncbi:MAG TPA: ABC transporter substrate-binding protein [Actinomycetota bacterium]|jgi:peptide/nickel transport system substrate-binding protein|nr:ABC transporter substrate-binding protein [Actinomycetota bacterium]